MTRTIAQPKTSNQSSAISARHLSLSQVIRRSARVAVIFIAARLLGPELFGVYALLLTLVELSAVLSGTAYSEYLTREIAKKPQIATHLVLCISQIRILYTLPAGALAICALWLLRFPRPVLAGAALLSFSLLPRAIGESCLGALKGVRIFSALPKAEGIQAAVLLLIGPALMLNGLGLTSIIVAEIVSVTAAAIYSVFVLRRHILPVSADRPRLSEVARLTFVFSIYPFIGNVYDRVDVVLLSKLVGNIAAGIYSIPYRIYSALQIIPYSIMGAVLPRLAAVPRDDAGRICERALKPLFAISLWVVLSALGFARSFLLVTLGNAYQGCVPTIQLLVIAAVPAMWSYALGTLFVAHREERLFLWTAPVCTIFNIVANLYFIPRYSYLAAAVVTILTELLLLSMNLLLVRKRFGGFVVPERWLPYSLLFALGIAGYLLLGPVVPDFVLGSAICLLFGTYIVRDNLAALHSFTKIGTGA